MTHPVLTALASASIAVAASFSGCLGVETYRERGPAPDLEIRLVAREGREPESVVPRLDPSAGEPLPIERGVVVDATMVRHVRLLDSAHGVRVIVLDLDDVGRSRLREVSAANLGGRLAIVAGGRVIAAPQILNELTENEVYLAIPEPSLERSFDALGAPD